jgi:hypothetical protein
MKCGRRIAALLMAAMALGGSRRSGAQSVTLAISALAGDSTSPAPQMTVTGLPSRLEFGPYTLSLSIANEPQFRNPFFTENADGNVAVFHVDSLMAEHSTAYFRARLIDAFGTVVAEARAQHPVRGWLRLIAPIHGPTTVVPTETPEFVWTSPAISFPPGLWEYELTVINTRTGNPAMGPTIVGDTSYTFPQPLEANTSYTWQVRARAVNSTGKGEARVASPGTFIIGSPNAPTVTLFYQNFPNPFGRGTAQPQTCFWFDLAHPSKVRLTIYDLRQHLVRHVLPGRLGNDVLPIGGYGREADHVDPRSGCDDRITWDGRDDNGRYVPPGVYLAIFEGDGTRGSIKILYKGP